MSKNIMFDIDGVLADFVLSFTKLAKQLGFLEKEFSYNQFTRWDDFGLSKDQMAEVWNYILKSSFWMTVESLINREVFQRIDELTFNHNVVFVTNREGIVPQHHTNLWLTGNGITNPSVILSKRKGEVARILDIDYSIEDKPENAAVIHWMADVRPCKSYIIDRPYNRVDYLPKRIKRVNTVEEFLDDIGR